MFDFDNMDKRLIIFGNIFGFANRLQSVLDRQMPEITARQWFLLLMLEMFSDPPTLKELARQCDSSHQNTKQICLKLQQKGFLRLEKDENDARALRIIRTEKCDEWGAKTSDISNQFIDDMFSDLTKEEIQYMCSAQIKLYNKLSKMGNKDYPNTLNLTSHLITKNEVDNHE